MLTREQRIETKAREVAIAEQREDPISKTRQRAYRLSVVRVGTNDTYPSINAASRATGLSVGAIGSAIYKGHMAGGSHWKRKVTL